LWRFALFVVLVLHRLNESVGYFVLPALAGGYRSVGVARKTGCHAIASLPPARRCRRVFASGFFICERPSYGVILADSIINFCGLIFISSF